MEDTNTIEAVVEKKVTIYNKTCKLCRKPFTHEARNTKYCGRCQGAPAANKQRALARNRRKKRRVYTATVEVSRLTARAYKLSQDVAALFIKKECSFIKEDGLICGCLDENELELHHRDCNPFNALPNNLQWLCNHHHKKTQGALPGINTPVFLTDLRTELEKGEINEDTFVEILDKSYGEIAHSQWRSRTDARLSDTED